MADPDTAKRLPAVAERDSEEPGVRFWIAPTTVPATEFSLRLLLLSERGRRVGVPPLTGSSEAAKGDEELRTDVLRRMLFPRPLRMADTHNYSSPM
jgi:hypothetical protein